MDNLDPARTALLLVDFQCGVVSGMGMALAPHSADQAVANARDVATALTERGGLVVLVRGSMGMTSVPFPSPRTDFQVPAGTMPPEAAEIVPELSELGAHVITKHQWGSFYGTELDPLLRRRGITTLLLGGIATNLGVESTAREAYDRGYDQVLVEDAATAFDAQAHLDSVARVFRLLALVRTADQVRAALGYRGVPKPDLSANGAATRA
ncbi:MAG: isochorismatase family protein [Umezawaea sp.]